MNVRVGKLLLAATVAASAAVPVALAGPAGVASADHLPDPVFTLYVPIAERDIEAALQAMISGGYNNQLVTTLGITGAANDTILYYDHWEDGYETDLTHPQDPTTEVWGDRNATNGAPPGCSQNSCDVFDAGSVATLTSNVPANPTQDRDPSVFRYDAGDRVSATRGVALTRAGWDSQKGVVHGGAVATSDLSKFGTRFAIPIGVDFRPATPSIPAFPNPAYSSTNTDPFEYVAASIMAAHDDTIVQIDTDADGVIDVVTVLDQGESYFTAPRSGYTPAAGLRTGARITADQPVQVHLITGDINHANESRWFEVFPDELLDSHYIAPVNTTHADRPLHIFVHNPNDFAIDVTVTEANGTTAITVAPRSTREHAMTTTGGAALVESDDGRFAAIAGVDMFTSSSGSYDWGYSLVPVQSLTSSVVVGWAPGMPGTRTTTYSPVWVSPLQATDIVVDYDGDGNVDHTFTNVQPHQVVQIADTRNYKVTNAFPGATNDHDMTGARIWSPTGVQIAAAYGQDASFGSATVPYDLGITVLPATALVVTKTARLVEDRDGDGHLTPGDVVEYTIHLIDAGALDLNEVTATDPLPPELLYVPGSSAHNGLPVADDTSGTTPFPFDEDGIVPPNGRIEAGAAETYTYRTVVDPNLNPAGDNIRNTVHATSREADGTATANINVWFPDLYVTKTTPGLTGPVLPGDTFDWVISVTNTGSSTQNDVTIFDALPDGVTVLDAELRYIAPNPALSVDVTDTFNAGYTANAGVWRGPWTESESGGNAGPGAGEIQIDGNNVLRMRRSQGNGTSTRWIRRTIDASAASSGRVSFVTRPVSLETGDVAAFQVSTDGTTWKTLDLWYGPLDEGGYTPSSYDLTAYAGAEDLAFRFWSSFGGSGTDDTFYVDDFRVVLNARTERSVARTPGLEPHWTAGEDIDLLADEAAVLTLRVQVDSPLAPNLFTLPNTATAGSVESVPRHATSVVPVKPFRVGDLVWDDLDGNGVRDPGEPGVAGVVVRLTGTTAGGVTITEMTRTTDADGSYSFDGLAPGNYTVTLGALPTGYVHVTDLDGTHDGSITTGDRDWGDEFDLGDFGLARPATIAGNVFRDLDRDEIRDVGEPPIAGVSVTLSGTSSRGDTISVTVPSAADGSYAFPDLLPGNYTVSVSTGTAPTGSEITTLASVPLAVTSGSTHQVDFGFTIPTAIDVTKTLNGSGRIVTGGTATFAITVHNPGPGALTDVVVTDVLAPDCDTTVATLAPGATHSYSCTAPAGDVDWTNQIGASGTDAWGSTVTDTASAPVDVIHPAFAIAKTATNSPIVRGDTATFQITVTNTGDVDLTGIAVSDVLAPDCARTGAAAFALTVGAAQSYTCSMPAVVDDVTNVITATALDPDDGLVTTPPAGAQVTVEVPGIGIAKTATNSPVVVGGTATFSITVTNTGQTSLTDVAVSDAQAPDCVRSIGTLAAGATHTYACAQPGVADDFTNVAVASATDPLDRTVSANASAPVDVIDPNIGVTITPDVQSVPLNGTATFTITVTNPGDVPLTDVAVTTPFAQCDQVIGDLAAGATISSTCDVPNIVADTPVPVTATGHDPNGDPVSDSDSAIARPVAAGLTVTKVALDGPSYPLGADVTFRITVTNTTVTPLTNVTVSDPATPGCARTFPTLGAAPASETFECTAANVTADFDNVVEVTATDPLGAPVGPATATAPVDVRTPGIEATKTAGTSPVAYGGSVEWTITVVNAGEADLTNVVVADDVAPSCARVIGVLPARSGATSTVTWTCTSTGLVAETTNTVVVTAQDEAGNPVDDSAEATVEVGDPTTIEGRVWSDVDGDGRRGSSEPGVPGVAVTLLDADGNTVAGTVTDGAGDYTFGPQVPGEYTVVVSPPGGSVITLQRIGGDPTTDSDVDSTGVSDRFLGAPGATTQVDAGIYVPTVIGDLVWFDLDHDGVFDLGEPPVAGVTLTAIWHGPDGVLGGGDDVEYRRVTGSRGTWSIDDAPPGNWTISAAPVAGWTSESTTITVEAGTSNLDGDVGLRATSHLGSTVYVDGDRDGTRSTAEPGAPGVIVEATWAGPDGEFDTADDTRWTTTTDASGRWRLDLVPPGRWRVTVVGGDIPHEHTVGDPVIVTIAPGTDMLGVAIPLTPPAPAEPSDLTGPGTGSGTGSGGGTQSPSGGSPSGSGNTTGGTPTGGSPAGSGSLPTTGGDLGIVRAAAGLVLAGFVLLLVNRRGARQQAG